MKPWANILALLGSFAATGSLLAIAADNPYKAIAERNMFHLNEVPKPKPPEPTPEPPPNVEFTGISKMGSEKKAWFVILAKAGTTDSPKYLSLREGERTTFSSGSNEGILWLKEIIDEREEARVEVSGKETSLQILKHSSDKAPRAGGVPPPPVAMPQPQTTSVNFAPNQGGSSVVAGARPNVIAGSQPVAAPVAPGALVNYNGQGTVAGASAAPGTAYSQRLQSVVASPQGTTATPQLGTVAVGAADGSLRTIPARTLRLTPNNNSVIATPPAKPMTQEESMIGVAVQTELNRDAIQRKELPPLPPAIPE
jgi:hypothetical protein